jgi:hypothetical protein
MHVKRISPNKNNRFGLDAAGLNSEKSLNKDTLLKLEEKLRQLFQQDQQATPALAAVSPRLQAGKGKVIRRRRGEQDKRISS